jgi:hypothetical protein
MLVAKNAQGDTLEIVKQWKNQSNFIYRFQLTYANERSFFTGNQYTTKELILADAYSVALSKLCDCFKQSDIAAGIQNSEKFTITDEQKTALHIALNALNSGTEQQQIAAFYIKQLIEKV